MTRRPLSTRERLRLFTLHGGICHLCDIKIDGTREKWEISHDTPLALGGDESDENRKPAHVKCHQDRTAGRDIPMIAKANRLRAKHIGVRTRKSRPMLGSRDSGWQHKMNGDWVRR